MLDIMKYKQLSELYKSMLLQDVIPFWEQNLGDWRNGGYYTYLDTHGKVFENIEAQLKE